MKKVVADEFHCAILTTKECCGFKLRTPENTLYDGTGSQSLSAEKANDQPPRSAIAPVRA